VVTGGQATAVCAIRKLRSTFTPSRSYKQYGLTALEASVSDDTSFHFEEFVRSRSAHLFRLALLLTGQNWADAEDLLQIALERAYRRRALLARDRSPEPYVRKVLVNASIDRRRWLRRRGEQPLDYNSPILAAEDQSDVVANRDLLLQSLAALPKRQRAVLVLRYWEDLSELEIASTLGCSVGTVKSQASRGLARLREMSVFAATRPLGYWEVLDGHD
jgi:RNA polymerase sigma-70 factor (sigma-E family)